MEATINQIDELTLIGKLFWPHHSIDVIRVVFEKYIKGEDTSIFINIVDNKIVGFALVSLRRDYVEGCSASPVGYLEGIYVDKDYRREGIASLLNKECEIWAKNKGCKEFASDCELINDASYNFHLSSGYKEVNRIIHFKKDI